MEKVFYRRRLPHWQPPGARVFLTWRLHGSLPLGDIVSGHDFARADAQLDCAQSGPLWLADERIAALVAGAFAHGENGLGLYRLSAWVVMSNHVHLLLRPEAPLRRITGILKGFTARQSNRLLGRTGEPFWRDESFDHWVRGDAEAERIVRYIERNPVRAGMAAIEEEWRWSSAYERKIRAGKNACATS